MRSSLCSPSFFWPKMTTTSAFRFTPNFKDQHVSLFRADFSPKAPFLSLVSHLKLNNVACLIFRLLQRSISPSPLFQWLLFHLITQQCLSKAFMKTLSLLSSHQTIISAVSQGHRLGWVTEITMSFLIWHQICKLHPVLNLYSLNKYQHM